MTFSLNFRETLVSDPRDLTALVEYERGFSLQMTYCPAEECEAFSEANTKKRRGREETDITSAKEREFWLKHWLGWEGLYHEDASGKEVLVRYDAEDETVITLCGETNEQLRESNARHEDMTPDDFLTWLKTQLWNKLGLAFRQFIRDGAQDIDNFRKEA